MNFVSSIELFEKIALQLLPLAVGSSTAYCLPSQRTLTVGGRITVRMVSSLRDQTRKYVISCMYKTTDSLGSGCGSVGRAVASNNCVEKTKIKKKVAVNVPFFKKNWIQTSQTGDHLYSDSSLYGECSPVWPDWAIYWTLGKFLKHLAIIILPKSPTFISNFCKNVKIYHFSCGIIFGQLL